jgi:cyclase
MRFTLSQTRSWLYLFVLFTALSCSADSSFTNERLVTKIADGIYVIRHKDPAPGWVHGNTTVIIGERDVLVVDSCQTPSAAREDIAQIRQWTSKPVRYVVNTHWHTDHNGGNHEYMVAFPSVAIISQKETQDMMDAFNPTVAETWVAQATEMRERFGQRLKTGTTSGGAPLTEAQRTDLSARLKMAEQILIDAKEFVYQRPTLTFDRELSLDLGGREIQVKHLGRANTVGDAVVYLPREKVLITGDILVHPIPFAFDGYPSEWIQTLKAIGQLDSDTIVPGHGDILHNKSFLSAVEDLMQSVIAQVEQQFRKNPEVTLEEVKKSIDLKRYREMFTNDDKAMEEFFDSSIGSFVELAYHEWKQR